MQRYNYADRRRHLSLFLSLSLYLSLYLSLCLSLCLSLSVSLFLCFSLCLSISRSIYIYLSIYHRHGCNLIVTHCRFQCFCCLLNDHLHIYMIYIWYIYHIYVYMIHDIYHLCYMIYIWYINTIGKVRYSSTVLYNWINNMNNGYHNLYIQPFQSKSNASHYMMEKPSNIICKKRYD